MVVTFAEYVGFMIQVLQLRDASLPTAVAAVDVQHETDVCCYGDALTLVMNTWLCSSLHVFSA